MRERLASIGFGTRNTSMSFTDNNPVSTIPVEEVSSPTTHYDNGVEPYTPNDAIADIVKKESGGNYKATNKNSSAAGKYQFLWNAWGGKIRDFTGVTTKEEFLNNPKAQDDFFYNYYLPKEAKPAIKRLKGKFGNVATDDEMLKLFHFRGEGGAKDYLSGNLSDTPEGKNNMAISKYTGIPKLALGGFLPKKALGGVLSAVGTIQSFTKPLADLIEGDGTSIFKSATAGYLQSGLLGAATKGIQAYKANQLRQKQDNENAFMFRENNMNSSNAYYNMLGNNSPKGYYSKGGELTPEYEVEKDEVVIGNANLEKSTTLAEGVQKVGGKTHEEGGTLGQGGDFALSNRLYVQPQDIVALNQLKLKVLPNSTYANAAEQIVKQNKKFMKPSFRYRESNTGKSMIGRMGQALQFLAMSQENQKQ